MFVYKAYILKNPHLGFFVIFKAVMAFYLLFVILEAA